MSIYTAAISNSIGRTDTESLALVEELMRVNRTALDHLSSSELAAIAREAFEDARLMDELDMLASYCQMLGLGIPEWATTRPPS